MSRSLDDPRYESLIKLLRSKRLESDLTQIDVADAMGKSQSFVAKIEGLERRLDVLEFIDLCRTLAIDPKTVLRKLKF